MHQPNTNLPNQMEPDESGAGRISLCRAFLAREFEEFSLHFGRSYPRLTRDVLLTGCFDSSFIWPSRLTNLP